jgi:hypothetical protein
MQINRFRGTVADRPLDTQVVQTFVHPTNFSRFDETQPTLARTNSGEQQVWLNRLPNYEKGAN